MTFAPGSRHLPGSDSKTSDMTAAAPAKIAQSHGWPPGRPAAQPPPCRARACSPEPASDLPKVKSRWEQNWSQNPGLCLPVGTLTTPSWELLEAGGGGGGGLCAHHALTRPHNSSRSSSSAPVLGTGGTLTRLLSAVAL